MNYTVLQIPAYYLMFRSRTRSQALRISQMQKKHHNRRRAIILDTFFPRWRLKEETVPNERVNQRKHLSDKLESQPASKLNNKRSGERKRGDQSKTSLNSSISNHFCPSGKDDTGWKLVEGSRIWYKSAEQIMRFKNSCNMRENNPNDLLLMKNWTINKQLQESAKWLTGTISFNWMMFWLKSHSSCIKSQWTQDGFNRNDAIAYSVDFLKSWTEC